jgi:hypothetical protein
MWHPRKGVREILHKKEKNGEVFTLAAFFKKD